MISYQSLLLSTTVLNDIILSTLQKIEFTIRHSWQRPILTKLIDVIKLENAYHKELQSKVLHHQSFRLYIGSCIGYRANNPSAL